MRELKQHRGNMLALILGLVVVVMAMWMLRQCSRPAPSPFASEFRKSAGDTLDVAIQMAPNIYEVHGDSIGGRDYQLIMEMAAQTQQPVKLHPFVPLAYALDGLREGMFDIVVASLPLTAALRDSFLMTEPIYLDREILVQRRDTAGLPTITSQLQLAGDTVWLASGSPFAGRIANLANEIGDTIYVRQDEQYNAEQLIILVATGRIKQAVVGEDIAQAMLPDYPQLDASTPISFTQFQSWALAPADTALATRINAWLKTR